MVGGNTTLVRSYAFPVTTGWPTSPFFQHSHLSGRQVCGGCVLFLQTKRPGSGPDKESTRLDYLRVVVGKIPPYNPTILRTAHNPARVEL